jgi:hypothetical protein
VADRRESLLPLLYVELEQVRLNLADVADPNAPQPRGRSIRQGAERGVFPTDLVCPPHRAAHERLPSEATGWDADVQPFCREEDRGVANLFPSLGERLRSLDPGHPADVQARHRNAVVDAPRVDTEVHHHQEQQQSHEGGNGVPDLGAQRELHTADATAALPSSAGLVNLMLASGNLHGRHSL